MLDRIVGYKISPLLWKKVKKGLSAGRVQSVATRLVCDREAEIEAFCPEEFWTVDAELIQDKKKFLARFYGMGGKKQALKTKEDADEVLKKVEGAVYTVTDVKKGQRTKKPAPPFTTSTLQQEAGRKLGFTTLRTMRAAQQLYEGVAVAGHGTVGLITYMRTDSLRISAEAQAAARAFIGQQFGAEYFAADEHGMADLFLRDAEALHEVGKHRNRRGDVDVVAAAQHGIAGRNECVAVTDDGADEHLAAQHMRQVI